MDTVIHLNNLDIQSFVIDPAELGGDQKPGFNCPNCKARSRVFERLDPVRAAYDDSYCHAAIASLEDLAQIQVTGGHCDKTAVGNVIGQSERGWPVFEKKSNQIIPLLLELKEKGFFESEVLNRKPKSVCSDYATALAQENLSLNLQQLTGIWVLTFAFVFIGLLVKCINPCYDRRKLKTWQSIRGFDQLGQEINFMEDQGAKWVSARGIIDQRTGRRFVSEEIAEEIMMNISGRNPNRNILALINAAAKRRGIEKIVDRPFVADDLADQIAMGLAERHINQNVISFAEILKNRRKDAKEKAVFQSLEQKTHMDIVSDVQLGSGTSLTKENSLRITLVPGHLHGVNIENEVEREFQSVFTEVNTDFVKTTPLSRARKRSSIDTDSLTVPQRTPNENENIDFREEFPLQVPERRSCSEFRKMDPTTDISERSAQTQLDPLEHSSDILTTLSGIGESDFISEINTTAVQKKKSKKKKSKKKKSKGTSHESLTKRNTPRKKMKRLSEKSLLTISEYSEKLETPVQSLILEKNLNASFLCKVLGPLPLQCVPHDLTPKLVRFGASVGDEIP